MQCAMGAEIRGLSTLKCAAMWVRALLKCSRDFKRCHTSEALVYKAHGNPKEVLALQHLEHGSPAASQVLVDFLAIQGKYPIKPPLPAVAGNEGVARVRDVGPEAPLSKGALVIPLGAGVGTWRQSAVFDSQDLHVLPEDISIDTAATMAINPPTALRMLEEFVNLQAGDVVVQNGANSAVGQLVIQLARAKGVHTVNVVRPRPDLHELEAHLQGLGADVVTTDDQLKSALASSGLPRPKLGLNCVGGASSTAIAKSLAPGATIVTYGGMSMKPVTIPTSLLVFKDLACKGFWLSGGPRGSDKEGKKATLDRLVPFLQQGKLTVRTKPVPFRQFQEAFQDENTQSGSKYLLRFDQD